MRNSTTIQVGRLRLDIETFSSIDLRATNVYRYVDDPQFMILMVAWGYTKDDVRVAFTSEEINAIPGLFDPEVLKVAHNAAFERICFSRHNYEQQDNLPYEVSDARGKYEYLPPESYHCTMMVAAEEGYPKSLDQLAVALGAEEKDKAGTVLINFFCKPNRKGERNLPEDYPEKWQQFIDYCVQDVRTLIDIDDKLGDFPTEHERLVYLADQRINDRGIKIDMELAEAAVEASEDNRMLQELEISALTGIVKPGSQPQMLGWLRDSGLKPTNLTAETIERLLLKKNLTDTQRKVLELRQELALVAAKKYTAALNGANGDGRLRGQFRFFGAHTGRWAGTGVQLHNLARASLDSDFAVESAILDLKLGEGADAQTLKALVRPMLQGPFTVCDYSAIEARVVAWLGGEDWALGAFRAGRDIYVETANRMSTEDKKLDRSQGKVAVLALGYNGGVNSLRALGADGTDAELKVLVEQWRRANIKIVNLWKMMGDRFRLGGDVGDFLTIERDGKDRLMRLPSGRALIYHNCEWAMEETQYGPRKQASFADPKAKGLRTRTYGGRLIENATQAVARDIMADAIVKMDKLGHKVVGHIHDEIIREGVAKQSVLSMQMMMRTGPAWSKGLPLDAEGFTCERYKKG